MAQDPASGLEAPLKIGLAADCFLEANWKAGPGPHPAPGFLSQSGNVRRRLRVALAAMCVGGTDKARVKPTVAATSKCQLASAPWSLLSGRGFSAHSRPQRWSLAGKSWVAGKQTRDQCMMYCNSWQGSAKAAMSQLRSFTSRAFRPAFLC